ncbi:hypothetical protein H0H93_005339, partial [Arthromyces matolae]
NSQTRSSFSPTMRLPVLFVVIVSVLSATAAPIPYRRVPRDAPNLPGGGFLGEGSHAPGGDPQGNASGSMKDFFASHKPGP